MRMLKQCTVCLERKPVRSDFRPKGKSHHAWCRDCENEEKRAERKRKAAK